MKSFVKKIKGVRGFVPDSWWVFDDNNNCLATFLSKVEADEFSERYNKENNK